MPLHQAFPLAVACRFKPAFRYPPRPRNPEGRGIRDRHVVAPASVPAKPDTAGTEACATAWGFDDQGESCIKCSDSTESCAENA